MNSLSFWAKFVLVLLIVLGVSWISRTWKASEISYYSTKIRIYQERIEELEIDYVAAHSPSSRVFVAGELLDRFARLRDTAEAAVDDPEVREFHADQIPVFTEISSSAELRRIEFAEKVTSELETELPNADPDSAAHKELQAAILKVDLLARRTSPQGL